MSEKSRINRRWVAIIASVAGTIVLGLMLWMLPVRNDISGTPTPVPTLDRIVLRTITDPIPPGQVNAYARLADVSTLELGETIYGRECASCHGVNGEGQFPDAPMIPDETGRLGAPPHNDTGHTWHHDDDLLIEYVINGGQAPLDQFYPMPAFGNKLSEEEVLAVIAYIKTMWTEEHRLIQAERTLMKRSAN